MLSMPDNLRKYKLGMSLHYNPGFSDELKQKLTLEQFDTIQLASAEDICRVPENIFEDIDISNQFQSNLPKTIFRQRDKIKDSFFKEFDELLEKLPQNVTSLTFDFDLESGFRNEKIYRAQLDFIRLLSRYFFYRNITLNLPVRIPAAGTDFSHRFPRVIQDIFTGKTRLSIDIHPHELNSGTPPEQLMKHYSFDLGVIRFIYEPEAGNKLVKSNLKPWFDYLDEIAFTGKIYFTPITGNQEVFAGAAVAAAELLEELVYSYPTG